MPNDPSARLGMSGVLKSGQNRLAQGGSCLGSARIRGGLEDLYAGAPALEHVCVGGSVGTNAGAGSCDFEQCFLNGKWSY